MSGKSNDVVSELNTVPAGNVVRNEILDGATLDIPAVSPGRERRRRSRQGEWPICLAPRVRAYNTDPVLTPAASLAERPAGPFEYHLGLQNNSGESGAGDRPTSTTPTDVHRATRRCLHRHYESPRVSARICYDGPAVPSATSTYPMNVYHDYRERGDGAGLACRPVRNVSVDETSYE
jgi:hypothetical protein